MELAAGNKLGPYEVVGAIGAGGVGEVYRALDTRLDRCVADGDLRGAGSGTRDGSRSQAMTETSRAGYGTGARLCTATERR